MERRVLERAVEPEVHALGPGVGGEGGDLGRHALDGHRVADAEGQVAAAHQPTHQVGLVEEAAVERDGDAALVEPLDLSAVAPQGVGELAHPAGHGLAAQHAHRRDVRVHQRVGRVHDDPQRLGGARRQGAVGAADVVDEVSRERARAQRQQGRRGEGVGEREQGGGEGARRPREATRERPQPGEEQRHQAEGAEAAEEQVSVLGPGRARRQKGKEGAEREEAGRALAAQRARHHPRDGRRRGRRDRERGVEPGGRQRQPGHRRQAGELGEPEHRQAGERGAGEGARLAGGVDVPLAPGRAVAEASVGEHPGQGDGRVGGERAGPGAPGRSVERDRVGEEVGERAGRQLAAEQRRRQERRRGERGPAVAVAAGAVVARQRREAEQRREQRVALGEPRGHDRVRVVGGEEKGGEARRPGRRDQAAVKARRRQHDPEVKGEALGVHDPRGAPEEAVVDRVPQGRERPEEGAAEVGRRPPRQDAEVHEVAQGGAIRPLEAKDVPVAPDAAGPAELGPEHETLQEIVEREAVAQRRRQEGGHEQRRRERKPPVTEQPLDRVEHRPRGHHRGQSSPGGRPEGPFLGRAAARRGPGHQRPFAPSPRASRASRSRTRASAASRSASGARAASATSPSAPLSVRTTPRAGAAKVTRAPGKRASTS
ncbi:MAG TPA: hypothetical protein VFS43_20065 [Polyangiaceae bacterium]|nr:hypothetical protein [Polyangiaceae bacterium]